MMKSSMMSRAAAAFVKGACAILILALFTSTPEVAAKGKPGGGGGGGGDTSGNEKLPSTIEFRDALGDGLTSDGDTYVDNTTSGAGDVEAFIGSQAKEGNIILKLPNSSRTVLLDFSVPVEGTVGNIDSDCLPTGPITLEHMEAAVSEGAGAQQGVYNLGAELQSVDVRMKLIFTGYDANNNFSRWFLNFDGGEAKACAVQPSSGVRVAEPVPGVDQWTVTNDPQGSDEACLEKHGSGKTKTKWCGSYTMPFFFTVTPNTN